MEKKLEKVASELRTDWLPDRDTEGFVKTSNVNYEWRKLLPEGGSYSSLRDNGNDPVDLIKKGYNMAVRTVKTMHLKKLPVFSIVPDGNSSTDGGKIQLATSIFDDASLKPGQKIDGFIGIAVHEASHCLYSDFGSIGKYGLAGTRHMMVNVLEDERIERNCAIDRASLMNYVKMSKIFHFAKWWEQNGAMMEKASRMTKVLNSVLALVRYPTSLSDEQVSEFSEPLSQIRNDVLLPAAGDFDRMKTDDMVGLADRIIDIIKKWLKDEQKNDEDDRKDGNQDSNQQSSQGGQSSGKNDSSGDGNDESGESGGDSESSKGDGSNGKTPDGTDKNPNDKKGDKKGKSDKPDNGKEECGNGRKDGSSSGSDKDASSGKLSDKQIEDGLNEAAKQLIESGAVKMEGQGLSDKDCAKETGENIKVLEGICTGAIETMYAQGTIISNVKPDSHTEEKYRDSFERVKRYVPGMRDAIECNACVNKYIIKGQKTGRLDCTKLVYGTMGADTIYRRKGEVKGGRAAVAVLIDESGSMCRRIGLNDGTYKYILARDTAVLLREALGELGNVDVFFYGHTTTSTEHGAMVLIDDLNEGKAIGNIRASGGNLDDIALVQVAKRVRQHTDAPGLLFIISDGAPCCNDPEIAVPRAVKTVESMGLDVISIGIAFQTAGLYKHHVDIMGSNDLTNLPKKVGAIISRALESKTARF